MLKKFRLSGNFLKIIACTSMLIDHMGLMLFPSVIWLRYVGRIAFPIFAFLISEGCRYTKNKLKYFLTVFVLGILCQAVYFIVYPNDLYFGILITFSFSIILIYALDFLKKTVFDDNSKLEKKILSIVTFLVALIFVALFCENYKVDYGFIGCLLPLIASIFDFKGLKAVEKYDNLYLRIFAFSVALLVYFIDSAHKDLTVYCLLSIPLLFAYSGKRGKLKMKYLFYLFYPLHLVVLAGISYFI